MARRRKGKPVHGWLVLDKPCGTTSTEAVSRTKRLFEAAKAGHAGTLDPLATGILPIAFGEATKTVPYIVDGTKGYRFTVCWGAQTSTDDLEGSVVAQSDTRPKRQEIEAILEEFVGEISQVPPQFSAIKVDGARAYDLARQGDRFELAARIVHVDSLEISDLIDADHCVFSAICGKGTYIRALARDMGHRLGCLGHVSTIRRTRVGPFEEEATISLDKLEEIGHSAAGREALLRQLMPVETALDDIPALAISRSDAARLKSGQPVLLRGRDAPILKGSVYATTSGTLVAIGEISHGELRPTRVFNLPS